MTQTKKENLEVNPEVGQDILRLGRLSGGQASYPEVAMTSDDEFSAIFKLSGGQASSPEVRQAFRRSASYPEVRQAIQRWP